MRTAQRDQGGTITFGMFIVDAGSGAGVAQPGSIPYTFTRTGTGIYQIRFDPRLTAVSGSSTGTSVYWALLAPAVTFPSAGFVQVNTANQSAASVNGNFALTLTALDKRT